MTKLSRLVLTLALTLLTSAASAATVIWDGGGTNLLWSNPTNWVGDAVPVTGDAVVFDGGTNQKGCTANIFSNSLAAISLVNGYTNTVTFSTNPSMSLVVAGAIDVRSGNMQFTGNITMTNGGTAAVPWGRGYSVTAASVGVSNGASINSDALGFIGAAGPGWLGGPTNTYTYRAGAHAGWMGLPANGPSNTPPVSYYGTPVGPTTLGSGGFGGISGGGAIKISAADVVVNGRLSADGNVGSGNQGGASGGALWVAGGTLSGSGQISASGGDVATGNKVSGGGGYIDISQTTNNFAGVLRVEGGTNYFTVARGQAGCIMFPQSAGTGLTLNNFTVYTNLAIGYGLSLSNVTVNSGATLYLECSTNDCTYTFDTLTVNSNGNVVCLGNRAAINESLGGTTNVPFGGGAVIEARHVVVAAFGSINADRAGFLGSQIMAGPGGQVPTTTSYGRSHGGTGAFPGNNPPGTNTYINYGSLYSPTELGSAGASPRDAGGGALGMVVSGVLTNNGRISADGAVFNLPGGAGGSVWLRLNSIAGSGSISASGAGIAGGNGSGGGGRVSVVLTNTSATFNDYTGIIVAYGGNGVLTNRVGAAGTVYKQAGGVASMAGTVVVDNSNRVGAANACTFVPPQFPAPGDVFDLISYVVTNAGQLALTTNFTWPAMPALSTNGRLYLNGKTVRITTPYTRSWGVDESIVYENGTILWEDAAAVAGTAAGNLKIPQYKNAFKVRNRFWPTDAVAAAGSSPLWVWQVLATNNTQLGITVDAPTNFTITWGDGSGTTYLNSTGAVLDVGYTYTNLGSYDISMNGQASGVKFSFNPLRLTGVPSPIVGVTGLKSMAAMFSGCRALSVFPYTLSETPLPAVTNCDSTFNNCWGMTMAPAATFVNLPNVVNFNACFGGCLGMTNVPAGLFDACTNAQNMGAVFAISALRSVPSNLFDRCQKVTTFASAFSGCSALDNLPGGLFESNNLVTTFASAFQNCTNNQSVPADTFAGCTNVTTYNSAFLANKLQAVPGELFYSSRKVTDFTSAFQNNASLTNIPSSLFASNGLVTAFSSTFYGCGLLPAIPAGLFDACTNNVNFANTFNDCKLVSAVPSGLFSNNRKVAANAFNYTFSGCTNLSTIPADLFYSNNLALDFQGVFAGCASLTNIPSDLFVRNTNATTFYQALGGCTKLGSIPAGLFTNNAKVTTFQQLFYGCSVLTNVPDGMFTANTNVTSFENLFRECGALTALPSNTFGGLTKPTSFSGAFRQCTALTNIPLNLFDSCTNAVNFASAFYLDANLRGDAPALWTRTNVTGFASCFTGCTNLSNYTNIPAAWGGGGL